MKKTNLICGIIFALLSLTNSEAMNDFLNFDGIETTVLVQEETPIQQANNFNLEGKHLEAFKILRSAVIISELKDMELRLALASQYAILIEKEIIPADLNLKDMNGNLDNHMNAVQAHVKAGREIALQTELNALQKRVKEFRQGAYDEELGQKLAKDSCSVSARQGLCGGSNYNRGDCYECTGLAIEKTFDNPNIFVSYPGNLLNQSPYYAKFFATEWSEEIHKPVFRLSRTFYSTSDYAAGQKAANEAPIGAVIVWDKCGGSAAGHIAIVTKPGVACSSFCAPINDSCTSVASDGSTRIIGVFTPVTP